MSPPLRVVPVEGRIDRDQLRAVVRLLLGQGLRPGVDRSSGVKGNPLRQLVVSMTLMGLFFAPNVWRAASLGDGLVALYTAVAVLVLLAIVPETQEVRERHVEILGSKPLARRTVFAARGTLLAAIGSLIAGSFGVLPLLAAAASFGMSAARIVFALAGLLLTAFAAAVASLVAITLALRVFTPERVRRVAQTGLTLFLVAISLSSILVLPGVLKSGLIPRAAPPAAFLEWLPSTWIARLIAGDSPQPLVHAAGVGLLAAATIVLGLGGVLERFLPSFVEAAPRPDTSTGVSLTARVLRGLARLPLLRRLWLTPTATAVGETLIRSAQAEDLTRARTTANLVIGVGVFVLSFFALPPMLGMYMLLYFIVVGAIEGTRLTRQSTTADAAWIFRAAPVRGADLLHGMEAAVLLSHDGLPVLLLTILAAREYPLALTLLVVPGYLLLARVMIAATAAVDPAVPLSREPTVSSFGGLIAGIFVGGFIVTLYQLVAYAAPLAGALGWILLVLLDLMLAVGAWTLGVYAAARLDARLAEG